MPVYEENDRFPKPDGRRGEWMYDLSVYCLITLLVVILVIIILALLRPAVGNVFSNIVGGGV
jgi:hypothetical protein